MKIGMRVDRRELPFLNFKSTFFGILTGFALALFVGPSSQAQEIPLGPSVTLASLTNDTGILAGDKFFDDFTITSTNYSASDVTVTPIQENSNYGIRFGGNFFAINGNSSELTLGYDVTVVTNVPLLISDAHLLFDGSAINNGVASVQEQVFTTNAVFLGQLNVFAFASSNQLQSTLLIQPPMQQLILSKNVQLVASFNSFATASTIDQTFSQVLVPEPSALALSIASLAGLCLLQRRSRAGRRTNV